MLSTGRILPTKLLVKEPQKETQTSGGIILPPAFKTPTIVGEVVLIGAEVNTEKFKVEKGDHILHSPHSFVPVDIDGEEFRLVDKTSILFLY
jgi:co-chaperonin GroES (HSP10)